MWKLLRISLLLLALAIAVSWTWLDRIRTTSWQDTLWVGVYPLNGDGSEAADRYVRSLEPQHFVGIERFFAREAARYGIRIAQPVRIELYPAGDALPPLLQADAGPIATAWWSLRLRFHAAISAHVEGRAPPHIRMFVLYHDPERTMRVPHSLGLQKGLVGVVYAFADRAMSGSNDVVIAHEVLHTLGASDKYDLATSAPLFPTGFAEPDLTPRFPQRMAEVMAGRRPVSPSDYEMPQDLRRVVVGPLTAAEIRWMPP